MSVPSAPANWQITPLGSIIELTYGKSLPAKVRDGKSYPVFGSNGVVGKHSVPLVENPGLIIGRKGSFGEVHISEGAFSPIDTTYYVDKFHEQPIRYWFYQLRFLPLNQLNRATAIPGLNREDAYSQLIALPPLAEQKVIAEKLNTLLTQVDATKARLERIPPILKRFRQSVLAAAVSGRLTEDWRKIYATDRDTWKKTVFSDLLLKLRSGAAEKPNTDPSGTPVLRSSAIRPMEIDYKDVKYFNDSTQLKVDNFLRKGDLLFTRLSGSAEFVGNCALVKKIGREYQYPDRIFCARLKQPEQGRYLEYFFASHVFRTHILGSLKSSAGHQRITLDVIKTAVVHLPPIEEQTEIVRRVDQLFAYADTIERQVNVALERVNALTQSILAKAFRGELTEQWRRDNPDLISGENSAEALLARIQAKRAAQAPKKRTRKPKATA